MVRELKNRGPGEHDSSPFTLHPNATLLRFYYSGDGCGTRREIETGEVTNHAIHIRGSVRAIKRLAGYLDSIGEL